MPSLQETQLAFSQALLEPSEAAPEDIQRPSATEPRSAQSKRFDVYRNNVVTAALDALSDLFPAVKQLVGDDFFKGAARAYLNSAPPSSAILWKFGAGFPDFLKQFEPAAGLPYLGGVAEIEFARMRAYHAPDAQPIAISELAAVPAEEVGNAKLHPHPSAILVQSRYPIGSIWAATRGLMKSEDVVMTHAEDVLVLRPTLEVDMRILPAGGGAFFEALSEGLGIGEAAEKAATQDQDFDLAAHLSGLFEAGAFSALSTEEL